MSHMIHMIDHVDHNSIAHVTHSGRSRSDAFRHNLNGLEYRPRSLAIYWIISIQLKLDTHWQYKKNVLFMEYKPIKKQIFEFDKSLWTQYHKRYFHACKINQTYVKSPKVEYILKQSCFSERENRTLLRVVPSLLLGCWKPARSIFTDLFIKHGRFFGRSL